MSRAGESFQIFIALPSDDICTVKGLSRDMFVYQLKSRVELKAGIPGDIFSLFFMNVQLCEQDALKAYHLKHGCIVRIKIEQNWIGLFEACWRGDIYDVFENGVQFLDEEKFQGYNISLWNKLVIQRTIFALFISCHRGYLGLILELINRGATDINGKTIFGRSALHVAAYQGFVGCVSLLLSEGAICNQIDIEGKTPLALASENGHVYCERRLWLYQWNLQTFHRQSSSSSGDSNESMESERSFRKNGISSSPQVAKLLSARGTHEQPDQNNNNEKQAAKAVHLHLPRVTNNEDKRTLRRARSHEPPRSSPSPFPLMQIAEKYRKELREFNEGTLRLPAHAQSECKEEAERPTPEPETVELKKIWTDEVDVVKGANKMDGLEEGVQQNKNLNETSADLPKLKTDDDSTREQQQDNRDIPVETGFHESERPPSGKTNGIRKLSLLMSETREKCKIQEPTPQGQDSGGYGKEYEKENYDTLLDIRQEYSRRKPAQTFEDWLHLKQSQQKNRPCTAPAQKSRLGKSIDPESFKKWLNSKRHQRVHTYSESSTSSKKTFISSGGMTFDRWLETKITKRPMSAMCYVTDLRNDNASGSGSKVQKPIISGKPFEVWLAEKKAVGHASHEDENNNEQDRNGQRLSGKSFEEWLQDKTKQKQIELVQKMTTEKEQQRLAEIDQLAKWLNPHYKTYEDWLAIKNHQASLERMRAQNEPQQPQDVIPFEEKQKDAKVVYNIWQTMKALQELSDEERKYNEMKAKWAAKEREKEQLRRLNIANKAKKVNFKLAPAKS